VAAGKESGRRTEGEGQNKRMDGWMNRMGSLAVTDGRQKADSVIRNEELGNGKGELGTRKKTMNKKLGLRFRYTWDIIEAADKGLLPDKIMLNTHPQRWDDKLWPWVKELVWQNVKNIIKNTFM